MKRVMLIVALVLMATMPIKAERVSPETARKVATTFLNNNGAKTNQLIDLSKTAGFTNLYIFSTESSFVIIPTNDCAKPILGYSLSDKFSVEDMPENMRGWLQQYSDEIQWGIENNIQSNKTTETEWQNLKEGKASKDNPTVVVEPLLSTKWDQGSPYNMYCPCGTVTGCVATAMAQVMKYWNYPEQGHGSHSYTPKTHPEFGEQSANFGETTYNWDKMTNTYNNSSSDEAKQAVATLMYHCGVSVDMDYGYSSEGGSGATSSKVASALIEYFNYSPSATYIKKSAYTDEQWVAFLQSELEEKRPLFYRGRYENGGHAFVCDGYDSNNYFHFNWGWSGSDGNGTNNGYWPIGALNPGSSGAGSGQGTYNLDNAVIAWIEPLSNLESPIISASVNNSTITLEWDAITDAVSYNIYRDNIKIATNVTENNYADKDVVSGTYYEYYVRAVSEDTISNPSNHITKMCFYRDYTPTNLTTTLSGTNAIFNWEAPENNSVDLHYGDSFLGLSGNGPGKDTYWAEVFAPSRLTNYIGMCINMVSTYLYYIGEYKLIIYEGDPRDDESLKLLEQEFTNNSTKSWKNIEINTPITFDCGKELWVILFCPATNPNSDGYPATAGPYNEIPDDETNIERYNPRRKGESLTEWGKLNGNYSWLIRTYLTDGTYTYNIYDGETKLNIENITSTTYTHENPLTDATHHYTVTTNYYGGESEASNIASLTLGTASLETLELGPNDQMTVTENSTLTVTGTISNENPENLVLEDGAQLITNDTVAATMEKKIVGFGSNNNTQTGWYTIASPVATTPDGVILNNTYDLYLYDEGNTIWRNYKQEGSDFYHFNIEPSKGYLYANSENTTLSFAGEMRASNENVNIPLSYASQNETLKGFNLVGNPFTCELTISNNITIGGTTFSTYYIADGTVCDGKNLIACNIASRPIKPGEGFLVQATADNQSLVFNGRGRTKQKGHISIEVGNEDFTDRAYVQFGSGNTLRKMTLADNIGKVYVMHEGKDYAAVTIEETQRELPVCFKADKNGSYTLNIEVQQLELNYLHLIDNLTGDDIDLLAPPTNSVAGYTFEAKTTDYVSRFRLLFAPISEDTDGDEEAFAYYADGEIRLAETLHPTSLQIIDMTGRIIQVCTDGAHTISTNGMTPGVYVLRLIDGENVRTQKIVLE